MKVIKNPSVPHRNEPNIAEASTSGASSDATSEQVHTHAQEPTRPEGLRRRPRRPIDSLRDLSLVETSTALAKDITAPTTSTIGSVFKTAAKAVQQARKAKVSSRPLQDSLSVDLGDSGAQLEAHARLIDYGNGSAHILDRAVPFVRDVLRVGLAGTSMAFGVGRNSGLAAGDALARVQQRRPQSGAVFDKSPIEPSTNENLLVSTSVSIAAQLGAGSVAGATGNLLGQLLIGPVINLLPRQFHAVDPRAVVPDQIVNDMNALVPGAGDKLRESIVRQQKEITDIGSPSNIKIGQFCFDAVTGARAAALGSERLGAAGQVGFGLAVSATAGGLIGAAMATRQAVSTIAVPKAESLRMLAESGLTEADNEKELSQLMQSSSGEGAQAVEVPLFFARHMRPDPAPENRDLEVGRVQLADTGQRTSLSSMRTGVAAAVSLVSGAGGVLNQAVKAVVQGFNASPLKDPQPDDSGAQRRGAADVAAHTVSNVGASLVRRTQAFVKSTTAATTISAVTGLVARPMSNGEQRIALAIGNAVGIHTAIRPWFRALSNDIPAGDNLSGAKRRRAVNRQAQQALNAGGTAAAQPRQ